MFVNVVNIFFKLNRIHFLQGTIPPRQYQFCCFLFIPYAKHIRSRSGTVKLRSRLGLSSLRTTSDPLSLLFNSIGFWRDSSTFLKITSSVLGKGISGIGTSRNEHKVSHSSLRLRTRNLSSGNEFFKSSNHWS